MHLSQLHLQPGWVALDPEYAEIRAGLLAKAEAYKFAYRFGCDTMDDEYLAWFARRAERANEEPITWLGRTVVGGKLVCWLGLVQHALQ